MQVYALWFLYSEYGLILDVYSIAFCHYIDMAHIAIHKISLVRLGYR